MLLATDAIGGAILFTLVAAFTYATFYLAGAPFELGTFALGNVFCVYLLGVVTTPIAGRLIDRLGHRATVLLAFGTSAAGMLLTLVPAVATIVLGLALMACGVFLASSASQGFVATVARGSRSTAAALYLSVYYLGGGIGAVLPAIVWQRGGWTATVALIVALQVLAFALAARAWPRRIAGALGVS